MAKPHMQVSPTKPSTQLGRPPPAGTRGRKEGQSRGTGLGLAVTYGIIQEHAGKIRVESSPGAGTTFTLDFPLSRKTIHA